MNFPSTITRQRPTTKPDPINPRRTIASWDTPDSLALAGFIDAPVSTEVPDATRAQVVSRATLYLDDVNADVRRGDRITDGDRSWIVEGFPARPMNPFTGWTPYLVVNLKEVQG